MALLFVDSFDLYATADLTATTRYTSTLTGGGTVTIGSGNGRNSTNGFRLTSNAANASGPNLTKGLTTGSATAIIGAAYKSSAVATSVPIAIFNIMDGGTVQVSIALNSGGKIQAFRGDVNGGTSLGTSASSLSTGVFYYIEAKVLVHASAGTVEVRVNGSNTGWLALTGLNTRASATAQWNGFGFGKTTTSSSSANGATHDYDDLYVADSTGSVNNDFLGPVRIKAVLPDGAGNSTQFTPSTGSNYQNVDDAAQDGDSTYNSETTAGEIDLYTFGAIGLTGTVKGVQTNLCVRSDGAGAETIAPMFRISGTNYAGTTVGLTTSYTYASQLYETSPATSSAWTVSEIDGAESGIKLVS